MFFWLGHFCSTILQSPVSNQRLYQCWILSWAQRQQEMREALQVRTDRLCHSCAEWFGELKGKSCSYSCEVKQLSCWSMPTGKVKPVLGILWLFESFQKQSSQTRMSPRRALHINSSAEWLQKWELQPEFNPTTKKAPKAGFGYMLFL